MTTHKQYLVQVRFDLLPEQWWNAMKLTTGGRKTYAKTLDEAERAIRSVAYSNDPDQKVVESRIRVREVTEWEDVAETPHE